MTKRETETRILMVEFTLPKNSKMKEGKAWAKPAGAKGTFINRVAISSTMGPGVKVEPASLFVQQ